MSSIRRAAPADAEAIFDLERYAYDYPAEHVKILKKKFEGTFKEYYVLEEEGKIQGSGRLISFDHFNASRTRAPRSV